MKFNKIFYMAPLHVACEKENADIVKLLLSNPKIDINKIGVYNFYF